MKSLYMNPQYTAKNPIRKKKYLSYRIGFISGCFSRVPLKSMSIDEKNNRHPPWPISPYMTPNRKGNVIIVVTPGFAS